MQELCSILRDEEKGNEELDDAYFTVPISSLGGMLTTPTAGCVVGFLQQLLVSFLVNQATPETCPDSVRIVI